ncbi:hypothetical protein HHI36_023313 [Cryptolaemus montrouzieri]|uniref:Uncharacterized protein n=1 Tax=Cryptolaemus montrouzieri TaxID=559131 RepID=A0ABD2PGT2_9CUCU
MDGPPDERIDGSSIQEYQCEWGIENLEVALNVINQDQGIAIGEAASLEKKRLGPDSSLEEDAEEKLVKHLMKLKQSSLASTRDEARIKVYNLAENMKIKHNFNMIKGAAGYPWLPSSLRRQRQFQ